MKKQRGTLHADWALRLRSANRHLEYCDQRLNDLIRLGRNTRHDIDAMLDAAAHNLSRARQEVAEVQEAWRGMARTEARMRSGEIRLPQEKGPAG